MMKLGRVFGIALLFIGIPLSWLAYSMLNETGSCFRILMAGPVIIALGIGMIIFPGGNITAKESREKTKDPKVMIQEAPKSHLIAWVIFMVIGFIATQVIYKF
jgi:hypothetical protein